MVHKSFFRVVNIKATPTCTQGRKQNPPQRHIKTYADGDKPSDRPVRVAYWHVGVNDCSCRVLFFYFKESCCNHIFQFEIRGCYSYGFPPVRKNIKLPSRSRSTPCLCEIGICEMLVNDGPIIDTQIINLCSIAKNWRVSL